MAIRNTRFIIKNSNESNKILPSNLLKGEPIINTADGIMYFSGNTQTTNEWTPAGTGSTANFFEVGSNLYDLKLRNKITQYQGQTSGLAGKFLSGTTSGFVLADITDIAASTDSYTTGATWSTVSANTLTIELNNGKTSVPVIINTFTGLTLYGNTNVYGGISITGTGVYNNIASGSNPSEIVNYSSLTAFSETNDVYVTGVTIVSASTKSQTGQTYTLNYHGTPLNSPYNITVKDTIASGGTFDNSTSKITVFNNDETSFEIDMGGSTGLPTTDDRTIEVNTDFNWIQLRDTVLGPISGGPRTFVGQIIVSGNTLNVLNGLNITGTSYYNQTVSSLNPTEIVNVQFLTGYVSTNDIYVTGGTSTGSTKISPDATIQLNYNTGINNGTYELNYKDTYITGGTYSAGTITFGYNDTGKTSFDVTGIDGTDTYVTGFTWSANTNTLVIKQNQGETDLPVYINSFSGLSITNKLTTGNLEVTNPSGTTATIGQGGLVIGSGGSYSSPGIGDLTVHGDFIVFGSATTVSTNELYVEDPQISLNYNPTGNTYVTSIASGIRIQDGSGLSASTEDVYFTIARMDTFSGTSGDLGTGIEYSGSTGYDNRAWVTQLNDIVVRNTNLNNGAPNGARVLVSGDILDAGTY